MDRVFKFLRLLNNAVSELHKILNDNHEDLFWLEYSITKVIIKFWRLISHLVRKHFGQTQKVLMEQELKGGQCLAISDHKAKIEGIEA